MKKIISAIKRLFRVDYRLTIISAGQTTNTYGTDRKLLTSMAKNHLTMEYWTLYKRGPLFLAERYIDGGERI